MNRFTTKKLVLSALFAALTCVCTMTIKIPTPTGGYVHAGDCFVLLASFCLGPVIGGIAGGIGSMLSDLILGYYAYAPATFVIKFAAGFTFAILYKFLKQLTGNKIKKEAIFALSGIIPSILVMIGYFFYEWLLTSNTFAAAISGILGNAFQGLASILLSTFFFTLIPKNILIESNN